MGTSACGTKVIQGRQHGGISELSGLQRLSRSLRRKPHPVHRKPVSLSPESIMGPDPSALLLLLTA